MTIEIPDAIIREARLRAAELGVAVHQFVSEAMEEKLAKQVESIDPEDRV
jgi:hypothetical protein